MKDRNSKKSYTDLTEHKELLKEINIIRAGAAVVYAKQVRQYGTKMEAQVKQSQSLLSKVKTAETIEEKLSQQAESFSMLGDALISQRKMIGALTGIALSAVLLGERNDKQMIKLMRGRK